MADLPISALSDIGSVSDSDIFYIVALGTPNVSYKVTGAQVSAYILGKVPAAPVTSVNGQTGTVVLTTGNIADVTNARYVTDAELANILTIPNLVLQSTTVNGHALTGNITLTASDVGAPSGSGTSTGTNTGDQTNISGNAGTVTTINGLIEPDAGIAINGNGTGDSPYGILLDTTYANTFTAQQTFSGGIELGSTGYIQVASGSYIQEAGFGLQGFAFYTPNNAASFTQNCAGSIWQFGSNAGAGSTNNTFGIYSQSFGSSHSYRPVIQFNPDGSVVTYNNILDTGVGGATFSGNVGIGTASPGAPLTVVGKVNTATIPSGTLISPPGGLNVGDLWVDTTTSSQYPIVRMRAN
jgi:hypothetical protein